MNFHLTKTGTSEHLNVTQMKVAFRFEVTKVYSMLTYLGKGDVMKSSSMGMPVGGSITDVWRITGGQDK